MKPFLLSVGLTLGSTSLSAQMTMSLTSTASRGPVGLPVVWNAQVDGIDHGDSSSDTIWYRYRARRLDQTFKIIRDFGPRNDLVWTAAEHEGAYELEVSARDLVSGEAVTQTSLFDATPLAVDKPVITSTLHPLVFLYSAPPCAAGSRMRVLLRDPSGGVQTTGFKPCQNGLTMNFQIAGFQLNTTYEVHHSLYTGSEFIDGPSLTLTSGKLPINFAPYATIKAPAARDSGVLLHSTLLEPTVATDLNGNIIWYYNGDISFVTRPLSGGRFLGIYEDPTVDRAHQIVREFDLAGNTLRETNAARVNEQLALMGKRTISGFHHDAVELPEDRMMVLADVEQVLTDVQGPGPVDVIGDMILVLDQDLQVIWTWDAFDHLDPHRLATLNEVCKTGAGGCPPFYQSGQANDWLHGNAIQLTSDGNILYSIRHQDWVIKIDYNGGAGTGNVIWKLGKDGDFSYDSTDSYPWFSHQHDANIYSASPVLMAVFDNGNIRHAGDASAHSRGQVIRLNEATRMASPVLNADLGGYSLALGSARALPDGDFHFDLGFINDATLGPFSQTVEVDRSGSVVYQIQAATTEYRTFRVQSLYEPETHESEAYEMEPSARRCLGSRKQGEVVEGCSLRHDR